MTQLWEVTAAVAVIVVAARIFGLLARRLGQPEVVGEIAAGILLGPTLGGAAVARAVFPPEVRPTLALIANVAVCAFMFFVGLHLDRELLRGKARVTASASIGAVLVPFVLGCALGWLLLGSRPVSDPLAFVLFMGAAMSVTAFPVLARILHESGMAGSAVGALALACAAVDDVVAWSILAAVAAVAGAHVSLWSLLLVIPFTVLLVTGARRALAGAGRRCGSRTPAGVGMLVVAALGVLGSALVTQRLGLHLVFGAFMFGAVFPRDILPRWPRMVRSVERVNAVILLPVFFLVVGLKVDLSGLGWGQLGLFALICVVAIGGKTIGTYLGARLCGAPRRMACGLAVLLNTRGLTELIALDMGLQLGLLDQELYSLMVLMALVTTAAAGLLIRRVHPRERSGETVRHPATEGALTT